jgi:predicted RNA-binding Zn ribbon-like protein
VRVIRNESGFTWGWDKQSDALDRMLWPVARSAADLLTSDHLNRVHQCGGKDCTWLFVDTSRNHSRQWCDMGDCGNRAKARRFYQRTRGTKTKP